jgi:hypothetical protein
VHQTAAGGKIAGASKDVGDGALGAQRLAAGYESLPIPDVDDALGGVGEGCSTSAS